jgi:hypothetical protein
MESIILAKNIQVNNITFGDLKTSESGAKNIYISYNGKPLYAQTPEMSCVYGLSKWNMEGKGPDKYSMELSFQGASDTNSLGKFLKVLKQLNEKFIDQALQKGPEWFRKKFSNAEVVEAIYTSLIKYPKDKDTGDISDKYPPTFRLNIPYRDGQVTCPVYDGDKKEINLMEVETKAARVTAIIRISGLWIAGGKFGCTCKVEQLRVVSPKTIKGCAFQDEDDTACDEESDLEEGGGEDVEVEHETATESEPATTMEKMEDDQPQATKDDPVPVVDAEDSEDELEKPKIVKKVTRKKN